jgi:hypothetical protein
VNIIRVELMAKVLGESEELLGICWGNTLENWRTFRETTENFLGTH